LKINKVQISMWLEPSAVKVSNMENWKSSSTRPSRLVPPEK
jgi:hypothetical protein